jgi:FtsP/CotA-like multicopper oxidase with cupredoxin domain
MAVQRGVLMVPIAVLAALAVAAAVPTRARSQTHALAPPGAGDCTPHTLGNLVENPPQTRDPHNITLYVMTDAGEKHYCYKQNPFDVYREAPTIVVRNHGYFDFTLINTLPHPGPRPSPYMMQGGCPVLAIEKPTPRPTSPSGEDFSASPVPTPRLSYLNHERSTNPVMPYHNPGDTNVHTHGLDTNPIEDNVFKSTVAAKDGTCKYHIQLYAHQQPGTYWYHAHLHGIAENQVSGGLAGALIIMPDKPGVQMGRVLLVKDRLETAGLTSEALQKRALFANIARREGLTLPAALASAAAAAFTPVPNVDPENPPPWHTPTGNPLAADGTASADCYPATPAPTASPAPQNLQIDGVFIPNPVRFYQGQPVKAPDSSGPPPITYQTVPYERYRIIDGTANEYLNVSLFELVNGKPVQREMHVLARDGVEVGPGLAARRMSVLVPPAGRLDLSIQRSANPLSIIADGHFCAGNNGDFTPRREILRIVPTAPRLAAGHVLRGMSTTSEPAPKLASPGETAADKFLAFALKTKATQPHRVITFQQYWRTNMSGFYVTETSGDDPMRPTSNFVERPFWLGPPNPKDPHDPYVMPTIHVHNKQIEHWTLVNAATQIHAFHIHQLTFVTLNNPFEPEQTKVFEDTTPLMPGRPCIMQSNGTCVPRSPTSTQNTVWVLPTKTEIEIDFRDVPSGTWVFHCHMLNHEDSGMMGIIQVD